MRVQHSEKLYYRQVWNVSIFHILNSRRNIMYDLAKKQNRVTQGFIRYILNISSNSMLWSYWKARQSGRFLYDVRQVIITELNGIGPLGSLLQRYNRKITSFVRVKEKFLQLISSVCCYLAITILKKTSN